METFLISFLTVASLQFLALVAPGPDFALVTKNALLYSRREAVFTAFGLSLGITTHVSYCILGLAVLLSQSLLFFTILKYLGAAYLVYIGVQAFLAKTHPVVIGKDNPAGSIISISGLQAIRQGFLCNLLNPKASLFFIGLFVVVIKPTTPSWQQVTFGAWMAFTTFVWFAFVSCLITHPAARARIVRIQPMAVKALGVLLVLMGIGLLFVSHI